MLNVIGLAKRKVEKKREKQKISCDKNVGPSNFLKMHSITLLTAKQKTQNTKQNNKNRNEKTRGYFCVMKDELGIRIGGDDC